MLTVGIYTLAIPENGTQNTIIINRATKAPVLKNEPGTNGDTSHIGKAQSQTQTNEVSNTGNKQFVVHKKIFHVMENADIK